MRRSIIGSTGERVLKLRPAGHPEISSRAARPHGKAVLAQIHVRSPVRLREVTCSPRPHLAPGSRGAESSVRRERGVDNDGPGSTAVGSL